MFFDNSHITQRDVTDGDEHVHVRRDAVWLLGGPVFVLRQARDTSRTSMSPYWQAQANLRGR